MKDKWNNRYSSEEYFFGKEPNEFFKEIIDKLHPGKALFVAEGEGRNSVYAASIGWQVDAIDISDIGKEKAEKLAEEKKVEINYQVSDAFEFEYALNNYDAIVLIYFHIASELREDYFNKIISSLKPNGKIILLVYDEEHINNGSGGPTDINLLYNLESVVKSFIDLEFNIFAKEEVSRIKKGVIQKSTIIKFTGTYHNNKKSY